MLPPSKLIEREVHECAIGPTRRSVTATGPRIVALVVRDVKFEAKYAAVELHSPVQIRDREHNRHQPIDAVAHPSRLAGPAPGSAPAANLIAHCTKGRRFEWPALPRAEWSGNVLWVSPSTSSRSVRLDPCARRADRRTTDRRHRLRASAAPPSRAVHVKSAHIEEPEYELMRDRVSSCPEVLAR